MASLRTMIASDICLGTATAHSGSGSEQLPATKSDVFDQELFSVLRCPQSQSLLTLADDKLIKQINREIEAGRLVNAAGHRLDRPWDAGLIREAGDLLYPVIDAIPVMLPDEAVDLSQLRNE